MVRAVETPAVASPSPVELQPEMSEEERLAKQRELHRQRQERYRERQREENGDSELDTPASASPASPANVTRHSEAGDAHFQFKNPFTSGHSEPVKLLTKGEADEAREKLVYLFIHGSSLIDDLLEIIVKDHEPVQIWRMDEDEAGLFADAQLERSKRDKEAARVTRIMLRIYDRMMWIIYAAPRLKASHSHIKDHGGLSFR